MSSSSVAARARLTVFMETTLYRKGHARRESVGMHLAPTKEQDANLGADPRISNDQRRCIPLSTDYVTDARGRAAQTPMVSWSLSRGGPL